MTTSDELIRISTYFRSDAVVVPSSGAHAGMAKSMEARNGDADPASRAWPYVATASATLVAHVP